MAGKKGESKDGEAPVSFEKELAGLEQIVGKLEGGAGGLDESIRLYEEGVGHLKACQRRLAEAEAKIKMLVEGSAGPREKDFDSQA